MKKSRDVIICHWRPAVVYLALLVTLVFASVAIANPSGEFPLNDDWAWAHPVFSLARSKRLELLDWTGMTLVAQVVWGWIFGALFGFTFEVLRFSTLCLLIVSLIAIYASALELGFEPSLSFVISCAFCFNPFVFVLSCSFMTDVPFLAFSLVAVYFSVRGVRRQSTWSIVVATLFMVVAILVRQIGLVLPIALTSAFVARYGVTRRSVAPSAACLLVTYSSLKVYELIIRSTVGTPALYQSANTILLDFHALGVVPYFVLATKRLVIALLYVGLFVSPVAAGVMPRKSLWKLPISPIAPIAAVMTTFVLWSRGRLMPLMGNELGKTGLGPLTLRDTGIDGLAHYPELPTLFWIVVTFFASFGAVVLLLCVSFALWRAWQTVRLRRFFVSSRFRRIALLWPAAFYTALFFGFFALSILRYSYDRYLLVLLVPSVMVMLFCTKHALEYRFLPAIFVVACFAGFSVAATHDYFAWNRARWTAVSLLRESRQVSSNEIDGGFEVNALWSYDASYVVEQDKSWWWVKDDFYTLGFGPRLGYDVDSQVGFDRWCHADRGAIFILRRAQ